MQIYIVTTSILLVCYSCIAYSSDIPVGHLKPFGFHKPASVIIPEYTADDAPSPPIFFENHIKPKQAAIFRDVVKDTDAFKRWNDEYLRDKYGDMELRIEGKWEKGSGIPAGEKYLGRDTVRHFAENYHHPNSTTYAVSDLPTCMYPEVGVVPSLGACGGMAKHFVEINIWWSGGDSHSIIHKDASNQMNCLLNGTKNWKLIEWKYEKDIYKHWEPEGQVGGFSDINPQSVDLIKYPNIKKVEWSNFTIHAGDCLFLPGSYYHQVDSFETHNLAVSVLFGRFDGKEELDFSDCTEETDYKRLRRLSEFDVQWPYIGSGMMVMGRGNLEDTYRVDLLKNAIELEKEGLTFDVEYLKTMHSDWLEEEVPDFDQAFSMLDKDGDGKLSVDEIKSLSWDELRYFADKVEAFAPSNSYEYEYSLIDYNRVLAYLKFALGRKEVLRRKTWIAIYKKLGGTELFANKIFTRLAGDKSSVVSKDVTQTDIKEALENWTKYREREQDEMEDGEGEFSDSVPKKQGDSEDAEKRKKTEL